MTATRQHGGERIMPKLPATKWANGTERDTLRQAGRRKTVAHHFQP